MITVTVHVVVFYLCGRLERVDLLHYSHHPIPLMFVQNTQVTKQVYTQPNAPYPLTVSFMV